MATATRTNRSISLEKHLLEEVERTKGTASTSERVNKLLKMGLELERVQSLDDEAKAFFQSASQEDRRSGSAFRAATLKSLSRED
jgi:metal-responsive CopG/Arc/MetJ family transcriptional regulator